MYVNTLHNSSTSSVEDGDTYSDEVESLTEELLGYDEINALEVFVDAAGDVCGRVLRFILLDVPSMDVRLLGDERLPFRCPLGWADIGTVGSVEGLEDGFQCSWSSIFKVSTFKMTKCSMTMLAVTKHSMFVMMHSSPCPQFCPVA